MEDEKIKALQAELRTMRKNLEDYQRESLLDDGKIDDEEQGKINQMLADIDKAEDKIKELIKQQDSNNVPTTKKIKQWMIDNWGDGLTLREALTGVKQNISLMIRDEVVTNIYYEVKQIMTNAAVNQPNVGKPTKQKGKGFGDKIGDLLEFKFKYKGASIVVSLPSSIKAKLGIPLGTTTLDLELKLDTKQNVTFSLKFDHNERLFFSIKTKYSSKDEKITTGIYVSNTKSIYEKAPPEGITRSMMKYGDDLAAALNKLQKDPNDKDSQEKASKAFDGLYTYMKHVKATYSKVPSFSAGIELVVPLNNQPQVPGGLPEVPTIGFSVMLRF